MLGTTGTDLWKAMARRLRVRRMNIVAALAATLAVGAPAGGSAAAAERTAERHAFIKMDDGVILSARLVFPSHDGAEPADGRWPVVLTMTPYEKDSQWEGASPHPEWLAERGFVRAVVDVRGTGRSQGDRSMSWSADEQRDAWQVVEWLGTQKFSNGRVGMLGGSYLGIIQYFTAALRPPHLKAIVPTVALGDLYRDAYHGGIPAPGLVAGTGSGAVRPLVPGTRSPAPAPLPPQVPGAPRFDDTGCRVRDTPRDNGALVAGYLSNPEDGRFYAEASPARFASCIDVPALIVGGWFDAFTRGTVEMYSRLKRRRGVETSLWMHDRSHWPGTSLTYAPSTSDAHTDNPRIGRAVLDFFERHLRGAPARQDSRGSANLQVMGANDRYLRTRRWPPRQAAFERLYLGAGSLTAAAPATGSAQYSTNPLTGWTNTLSRFANTGTIAPYAPLDQRVEGNDGLVWQTRPVAEPTTIAGPLSLHLVATSTAPDTDWIARLADVGPDGTAELLTEGWLRASHRALDPRRSRKGRPYHTHVGATPIEPHRAYTYEIEIWPTAFELAPGHRLQLQLASNDTPNHLPGHVDVDAADPASARFVPHDPAVNTVHFGTDGSWLLAPVIR